MVNDKRNAKAKKLTPVPFPSHEKVLPAISRAQCPVAQDILASPFPRHSTKKNT